MMMMTYLSQVDKALDYVRPQPVSTLSEMHYYTQTKSTLNLMVPIISIEIICISQIL